MKIKRPECYPGTQDRITAPFYILKCSNGHEAWSTHPWNTPCPKCGAARIVSIAGKENHEK